MTLTGKVVKPTNKGVDGLGRTIDYSVHRGRAVEYIAPVSEHDKRLGGYYVVVWFNMAKCTFGKRSEYPAVDLATA